MDIRNVGGTPGGTRTFFLGLVMIIIGGYLLFDHVQVHGGWWNWRGIGGYGQSFGITLIPMLLGIGILFVNGKSTIGWLLAVGGLLVIFTGILVNLNIHFSGTSLMNTLIMLACIAAGFGLIVKGLRPHKPKGEPSE